MKKHITSSFLGFLCFFFFLLFLLERILLCLCDQFWSLIPFLGNIGNLSGSEVFRFPLQRQNLKHLRPPITSLFRRFYQCLSLGFMLGQLFSAAYTLSSWFKRILVFGNAPRIERVPSIGQWQPGTSLFTITSFFYFLGLGCVTRISFLVFVCFWFGLGHDSSPDTPVPSLFGFWRF